MRLLFSSSPPACSATAPLPVVHVGNEQTGGGGGGGGMLGALLNGPGGASRGGGTLEGGGGFNMDMFKREEVTCHAQKHIT